MIQDAAKEPTPVKEIPYSKNPSHNKELNRIHQSLAETVSEDAAKTITPLVQEFVEAGNDANALKTTIESMSPEEAAGLAADVASGSTNTLAQKLYIMAHQMTPEKPVGPTSIPGKPSSITATEDLAGLLKNRDRASLHDMSINGSTAAQEIKDISSNSGLNMHYTATLATLIAREVIEKKVPLQKAIENSRSGLAREIDKQISELNDLAQFLPSQEQVDEIISGGKIKTALSSTEYTADGIKIELYDAYTEHANEIYGEILGEGRSEAEAITKAKARLASMAAEKSSIMGKANEMLEQKDSLAKAADSMKSADLKIKDSRQRIFEAKIKKSESSIIDARAKVLDQPSEVLRGLSKLPIKISGEANGQDIVDGVTRYFMKKNTGMDIGLDDTQGLLGELAMSGSQKDMETFSAIYKASSDAMQALKDAGISGVKNRAERHERSIIPLKVADQIYLKASKGDSWKGFVPKKSILEAMPEGVAAEIKPFLAQKVTRESLRKAAIKAYSRASRFASPMQKIVSRSKSEVSFFDEDAIEIVDTLMQSGKSLDEIKGVTKFKETGEAAIKIVTGKGDASTAVHELSHVFRRNLKPELMQRAEKALEQQLKQKDVIENILGGNANAKLKDDNGNWTREAEEVWSRLFEKYVYEGKAPTNALKEAFEALKKMMLDVYGVLSGNSEINARINPELRNVFDEMLGKKPKVSKTKATKAGVNPLLVARDADTAVAPEAPMSRELPTSPDTIAKETANDTVREVPKVPYQSVNPLIEKQKAAQGLDKPKPRGLLARAVPVDKAAAAKSAFSEDAAPKMQQTPPAPKQEFANTASNNKLPVVREAEEVFGVSPDGQGLTDIKKLPEEKASHFLKMMDSINEPALADADALKDAVREATEKAIGRAPTDDEVARVDRWLSHTDSQYQIAKKRLDASFEIFRDKLPDRLKYGSKEAKREGVSLSSILRKNGGSTKRQQQSWQTTYR